MADTPKFKFKGLDHLKRKPDIEGKTGAVFHIAGDRWIRMTATTDNNPKWVAYRKVYTEGVRRLASAEVSDQRFREFVVPLWVNACFMDWGGGWVADDGNGGDIEIPFSPPAAIAALMEYDDVYEQVAAIIGDHKKFRDEHVKVVVDAAGN